MCIAYDIYSDFAIPRSSGCLSFASGLRCFTNNINRLRTTVKTRSARSPLIDLLSYIRIPKCPVGRDQFRYALTDLSCRSTDASNSRSLGALRISEFPISAFRKPFSPTLTAGGNRVEALQRVFQQDNYAKKIWQRYHR